MGLSSSQGRLLMLTSSLANIELNETMIAQRQSKLASESQSVAKEYNEAMSNHKIQIKVTDLSESLGYKSQNLNFDNVSSMGYIVTDANNNIYLRKDDEGNWIIPKNLDGDDLVSIDSTSGLATVKNDTSGNEYDIKDGSEFLGNSKQLQTLILNGVLFLSNINDISSSLSAQTLENDVSFEYVLDTSDDAAAESKYEYASANISAQDKRLELELNQLETQHNAVLKEIDSVKEVIDNNIERTFKLFTNG